MIVGKQKTNKNKYSGNPTDEHMHSHRWNASISKLPKQVHPHLETRYDHPYSRYEQNDLKSATFDRLGKPPVIVDATFLARSLRDKFWQLAKHRQVPFVILDCQADEATLLERLQRRSKTTIDASKADAAIMKKQLARQDCLSKEEQLVSFSLGANFIFEKEQLLRFIEIQREACCSKHCLWLHWPIIHNVTLMREERVMPKVIERTGSCLRGAARYTAHPKANHVDACHCTMCRKWGGGPFMELNCGSVIQFESDEAISVFDSSDWAERGFCSHLFYRLKETQEHRVPVGLFNNDEDLVFDQQVFIDQKPAYYEFSNKTETMTAAEVLPCLRHQMNSENLLGMAS